MLVFGLSVSAQEMLKHGKTILPYSVEIESIVWSQNIIFDENSENDYAFIDGEMVLHLRDSSNFLYLKCKGVDYKILSLFPNLYYMNVKTKDLFYIKFKSKVQQFDDNGEFIDIKKGMWNNYETDTSKEEPRWDAINANQYIIQPNNRTQLLVIDWEYQYWGHYFSREYAGKKIVDLYNSRCVFDDVNKQIRTDGYANDENIEISDTIISITRNISANSAIVRIGNCRKIITVDGGKDTILNKNVSNYSELPILQGTIYIYKKEKYHLVY